MQIFFLHRDPAKAAKMMCDSHMRKSIIELMQILSTVWAIANPVKYGQYHMDGKMYKPWPVPSHPSIQWTIQSVANYNWTCDLFACCLDEYHDWRVNSGKGDRVHACDNFIDTLIELGDPPLPEIGFIEMSPEFQAVPEELKDDNPVLAYRRYYNEVKSKTMSVKWGVGREQPNWYQPL